VGGVRPAGGRMLPAPGGPARVRRNNLDEMTIRRTEVPSGGTANAAGAPMRPRARKPSLDVMGPGTDRETPLPKGRPHEQDAREAHDRQEVPFTPEDKARPRPRSIGGRAGSDVGKRGRR
jgi:excinuclease ABC subunit B